MKTNFAALMLSLMAFQLGGCSEDTSSLVVPKANVTKRLDREQVIQGLLAEAKAAESDVAALRTSRFEISESTEIPAGKDLPSAADQARQRVTYRMEELKTYQARTQDPPEARALAESFLKAIFELGVSQDLTRDYTNIQGLRNAAVRAGAREPIFVRYSTLYTENPEDAQSLVAFRQKISDLSRETSLEDRGSYSDCMLAGRALELDKIEKPGFPKATPLEVEAHRRTLLAVLVKHLERSPQQEFWRSALFTARNFASLLPDDQAEVLNGELLQSPDVVKWYKLLAAARILKNEGWSSRGEGTSDTVSEDGWKTFHDKLELSRGLLLLAWKLHPDFPEAATEMIDMANVGAEHEWSSRQWFQQAVHVQCDYVPAYTMYQRNLQPRWGGSHPAMFSFAKECIDTGRFDTQVPNNGMATIWLAQSEIGVERTVMSNPDARNAVNIYASKALLALQNKQCQLSNIKQWAGTVLNWLVVAGDYSLAKSWLDNCGVEWTNNDLKSSRERVSRTRQKIAVCTGPASDVGIPLVEALYGPKIPEITKWPKLREMLAEVRMRDPGELSVALCDEMELVLNQYRDFEAGNWVEFQCSKTMLGWQQIDAEKFDVIDLTTFTMSSSASSQAILVARFQPPYLVEVDVQQFDPEGKIPNSDASILIGVNNSYAIYNDLAILRSMSRATFDGAVYFSNRGQFGERGDDISIALIPAANRNLRMKVWPHEVECSADGYIYSQRPQLRSPEVRIGLGTFWEDTRPSAYRFHRFRIRKLTYPPVIPIPAAEMDDYGQVVIDFDPHDATGYLYKAQGQLEGKKKAEAIETLESGLKHASQLNGIRSQLGFLYFTSGRHAEAVPLCRITSDWGLLARDNAILAAILACSADPSVRNPEEALKFAREALPDSYSFGASALAMAQAANGDFATAKVTIQTAVSLASDEATRTSLMKTVETIGRGEVPILEIRPKPVESESKTPDNETKADTEPPEGPAPAEEKLAP